MGTLVATVIFGCGPPITVAVDLLLPALRVSPVAPSPPGLCQKGVRGLWGGGGGEPFHQEPGLEGVWWGGQAPFLLPPPRKPMWLGFPTPFTRDVQ